ncbi:MAG: MBL fold metallo-hydrolase [Chthoniobacterales bacterium]|nr:MBL fold metallo-hydrolase [Chthoniobacterales bacterium]
MVHVLDTRQLGRPGIIAATAVETSDGLILFDTGPESTFTNVADGLRKVGFEPDDVRHVFLSHIHLDHAGAAWRFAELGATTYVHPRGAPHLLDPRKLIESAKRIFGDEMDKLWGRIAPVPAERLRVIEDGEIIRVGNLEVRAIATPGHASHHHVYVWDDSVFGGDIAGVQLGGAPPVPPFVPPELDIESWLESIAKLRELQVTKLYLPHFGLARGRIEEHLDILSERIRRWSEWLRDRLREGIEVEQLKPLFAEYEAADLRAGGASTEQVADYEAADPSYMAVTAAARYWRNHQSDAKSS